MKFLHISDVHLGCTRYQLNESPRDFFDAWIDVVKKYAVSEKVDFVVMGGDFFHKRNVPPETMNYAFAGLSLLKSAGIPVVTIEGNHDQKHNDSEYSWLRSLANWNLLYLLEPTNLEGKIIYQPWDDENNRGGFIDLGRARIFGSDWYGASANWAVPMLIDGIKQNRREGAFHILLLHTDIEGHAVNRHHIPALSNTNLQELRSVVDYVGLGHTHKCIEIDNWVFNPGSLEVTNIEEYRETRGAYLVEVDDKNQITARHVRDYAQRPFQQLTFDVSGYAETKDIIEGALEVIKNQARVAEEGKPQPIIEFKLLGQLGINASLSETLKAIREEAKKMTNALEVRIKNFTVPVKYAVAADMPEDASREKLERRIIEDLVVRDNRYKTRVEDIAEAVIGAKRFALSDEEPEKIADFISLKIEADGESVLTKKA
jgi:DNA repair exonuclease SbcCD nuclease subunit